MYRAMAAMLVLMLLLGGCAVPAGAPESEPQPSTYTTTMVTTTTGAPRLKQEGTCYRVTGDWRSLLSPVTEKEEQVDGYALLKKLRHKEKEYGYSFSATLTGRLMPEEQTYYLCEIGHWLTTDAGSRYEFVTWLMVSADLSAAYVAVTEGDLVWDTADNWIQ